MDAGMRGAAGKGRGRVKGERLLLSLLPHPCLPHCVLHCPPILRCLLLHMLRYLLPRMLPHMLRWMLA